MICGWPDVPKPIRTQVETCVMMLNRLLAKNLVGVYLHGSVVLSAFNPRVSDIDIIAVTHQPVTVAQKIQLAKVMLQSSLQPRPVEISILTKSSMYPWKFPPLYDFHFSEAWRHTYSLQQATNSWGFESDALPDIDLAAHITILNHFGIALSGPEVTSVFPQVPEADYTAAIVSDLEEILQDFTGNPVYSLLNCCRVLAYLSSGKILSKVGGGKWGLENLPTTFHPLLTHALQHYVGNTDESHDDLASNYSVATLTEFTCYVRESLAKYSD